jgi:hypothetical protein
LSRRVLSFLLAVVAGTALAGTTAAAPPTSVATTTTATPTSVSATSVNPPDVPVLTVHTNGQSMLGSDGKLYVRTDGPGSLDIVGIAPTGTSASDAGELSLVASKDTFGWDAAPLVSSGPELLSEWHWQRGASSLAVALSYLGSDGSISPSAVQTIVAVSGPPAVAVEPIRAQPDTTTPSLAWTETDGAGPGIVDRQILREEAAATSQGCGAWTKRDIDGVSAGNKSMGSESALKATAASTPGGENGLTTSSWALALADLGTGHCYRFTLFVTDALGLVGQDTTPVYFAGLLDPNGQSLPAWTGRLDIFRTSAYTPQQTWTWCVAASTQMMVNLIRGTSDSTYDGQLNILSYARANDDLSADAGAGLIGWQGALDKFSGTPYEVETVGSLRGAIKLAALRLRLTNRPVGLAVHNATHAWVMTGFEATADPAFDPAFTVTAVYVSGPLYPRRQSHGYDKAPDTRLSVSDLAIYFTPVSWKLRPTWEFVAPLP